MIIETNDLEKTFPGSSRPILSIPQQQSFGSGLNLIFGPSGSGKTTLLRLLAGLDRPTKGTVQIGGSCISALHADEATDFRRIHIGYVFQDTNLVSELTAWENVALPLTVDKRIHLDQARDFALEALNVVGLTGFEDRFPEQLSGGQQQRVGIARAICGNREVILADEPTGALDTANSIAVFSLLAELAHSGRTVVLVSHDLTAQRFASRIFEISDGRLYPSISR